MIKAAVTQSNHGNNGAPKLPRRNLWQTAEQLLRTNLWQTAEHDVAVRLYIGLLACLTYVCLRSDVQDGFHQPFASP